ncbi:MAG: DUF202 domain-containing protein [Phycisphaerae bacterium]|nr:DUF202 domain-containing protein [Phycisphaerae bacterium]
MRYNPYSRFRGQNLTLNDHLAIDRTVMANERTLLAYGRSALALVVVGGTCIKFFAAPWIQVVGGVVMAAGVLLAGWGWHRYSRAKRRLAAALEREAGVPAHPLKEHVSPPEEEVSGTEEPEAGPPPGQSR